MLLIRKIFLFVLFFVLFFVGLQDLSVYAENSTDSASLSDQARQDLQSKITEYERKINDLQGQEKTLSSQLAIMDNQARLTEYRIKDTQEKVKEIEKDVNIAKNKINNLQEGINNSTISLISRITAVYEVGAVEPWQIFFASSNITNFFTRLKYLRMVQIYDKKNIYAAEQARVNYSSQKNILEDKQKEEEALKKRLETYSNQLKQEEEDKKALLVETQGNEETYQKLLAQAKAQLEAFSNFTASQGGASLLSSQTICDSWGCYYNQRDSNWGGAALNNTKYTIASDGCLLTSMAMVYTHFGFKDVTPLTINSNSSNFASYYPAYLKKEIIVNNKTSTRIGILKSAIDNELSSGRPVIAGISYDGGPIADHFVVIISGSSGNYKMNDPFTPNGHNIDFNSHYSVGNIVEVDKIQI